MSKDDEERKECEEGERLKWERERLEQEREECEESERLKWEREERERLEWQQLEQEERERIERERVEREQDTDSEQDIVVTGIEEEEVSTMMQERVAQGLSCVLPQQFHLFVTTGVEAAATETYK